MATALVLLCALFGMANANFASRCYTLGRARVDPIVNFGLLNSHEHTFFGSDAISAYTESGSELSRDATCTSCGTADTSSYWFPSLFWDGEYARVDQAAVYWSNSLPGTNEFRNITLMPLGLRAIEGSPFATKASEAAPFYNWYCFGALTEGHKTFPPSTCPENKMRLSLLFPSCWNAKDRYLPKSAHVAHTLPSGNCPRGFTRTWSLRLEIDFALDSRWSWGAKQGHRFSLGAANLTSAYSIHADFFNGMTKATQRKMMDDCGDLGGDFCNVRPERSDCTGRYLRNSLPMPVSRKTRSS